MAKDREIICKYYTDAGGPCDKRGISVHFKDECQTCRKYCPIKGAKPARVDNRRKKAEKIMRKEKYDY